jgi:hypothetical protein
MFRKIGKYIFGLSILTLISSMPCFAVQWWDLDQSYKEFPYIKVSDDDSDKSDLANKTDIKDNDSIINRLLKVFWLSKIDWDHKFISYVRAILNIALWLLSMVALIMTIYTFYLMFFTENEAWAKKAKWNLVGIFIALAIIGLAWLIVSFIFRRYQNHRQNALN